MRYIYKILFVYVCVLLSQFIVFNHIASISAPRKVVVAHKNPQLSFNEDAFVNLACVNEQSLNISNNQKDLSINISLHQDVVNDRMLRIIAEIKRLSAAHQDFSAESLYRLAKQHENGFDKNYAKALVLYRMAALKGKKAAQNAIVKVLAKCADSPTFEYASRVPTHQKSVYARLAQNGLSSPLRSPPPHARDG